MNELVVDEVEWFVHFAHYFAYSIISIFISLTHIVIILLLLFINSTAAVEHCIYVGTIPQRLALHRYTHSYAYFIISYMLITLLSFLNALRSIVDIFMSRSAHPKGNTVSTATGGSGSDSGSKVAGGAATHVAVTSGNK